MAHALGKHTGQHKVLLLPPCRVRMRALPRAPLRQPTGEVSSNAVMQDMHVCEWLMTAPHLLDSAGQSNSRRRRSSLSQCIPTRGTGEKPPRCHLQTPHTLNPYPHMRCLSKHKCTQQMCIQLRLQQERREKRD